MKKLFYTLILSIVGIASFNIYSKRAIMHAQPDYKWVCNTDRKDNIAYYDTKEQAEKICPNDAIMEPYEPEREKKKDDMNSWTRGFIVNTQPVNKKFKNGI